MARTSPLSERFPSLGPAVLAALLLVAVPLGGCVGAPAGGGGDGPSDGQTGPAGTGPPGAGADGGAAGPVPLRFVEEDRPAVEETVTVTVQPEDALIPVAGPVHTATGGEHRFVKEIDLTHLLPPGTHAHVEASATWERTTPGPLFDFDAMNLQWFSFDLWISGEQQSRSAGQTNLGSYVTNHGPDPALMALIVIVPERLHEPVEVPVEVRVTYLDDAVHGFHPVAAELGGGDVPVTVQLGPGDSEATLQVRGPDEAPVLTADVADNDTVTLPSDSPAGEYRFILFGNDAPARLLVPEANRTSPSSPGLRPVDTSLEFGEWTDAPVTGESSWTVDLDRPPYWVGVVFDGLDGRSFWLQNVRVTVTAPDGTAVVDATLNCQVCWYSTATAGSSLADDALTPGTYTIAVTADLAQGFRMTDIVSMYGR